MAPDKGPTRRQLIDRLRSERDPEVLGASLDHPAWQVRWAVIESLGHSGSPAAEAYLLRVLEHGDHDVDLPHANAALGRVGSRRAIPALSALIHHPVEDIKTSAIHALGVLGDGSLTPVFLDALTDRSWVAKWYAMEAIHRHGDARAIEPVKMRLRSALDHERKTRIGGWSEVMYALDFLRDWQTTNASAAAMIQWVRSHRLDRLHDEERAWFESTFDASTG